MNSGNQEFADRIVDQRTGLAFSPAPDVDGLEVVDPVERRQYTLSTPGTTAPVRVGTDRFRFPVDVAVSVTTRKLTLPTVVLVYVRDETGETIAEAEHFAYQELPEATYHLELCAPIKLYLRVEGSLTIAADTERTHIEFGEETDVAIGARTHHEHPAGTITTTEDPHDVMAAVSAFGSALKTTSPERSYPTLRGHPPTVELGDELHVPEGLEPPETGVRIEVPPDLASVYVVAPLAYYLGATVVPGSTPRLVTDAGFEHAFDGPLGFERGVERVLKQTFFLDCLTRTEGYYRVDLHEREQIEPLVDLDFAALYDRPLAEQVAAYLSVPFEVLADHLPEWKLTTHVSPTPDSVEMLPFVVDDLAVVRTPQAQTVRGSEIQAAAIDEFLRDDGTAVDAFTRGAASHEPTGSYVKPESDGSLEQTWIGDGTPVGASKATVEAFRNRLARTQSDGDIDITVVCNDAAMDEERDVVDDVYGSRAELPFDVEIHHGLTADELRDVLGRETDFLHYIGHIDAEGFQCADGKLDVGTLDAVGVDAFLLNACASYEQGLGLIEAGAIGGIVTLSDVINSGAVRIGSTVARLLNGGFPLQSALEVARGESLVGGQYIVVGDGNVDIAQAESGVPILAELECSGSEYELTVRSLATTQKGMGSLAMPYVEGNSKYFLNSGVLNTFELSKEALKSFFALENIPVQIEGEFQWSDEIDLNRL